MTESFWEGQRASRGFLQVEAANLKPFSPSKAVKSPVRRRCCRAGKRCYSRCSGATLFAAPFDVRRLKITGEPVHIVEGIRRSLGSAVQYSFSKSGTLIS